MRVKLRDFTIFWLTVAERIAATRAAEAGATVAQLNAIFGWTGTAWPCAEAC